eukprot:CAMPEP_0170236996 /NCGR_PEP_ID=MMETSP0116_2-20130129/18247_1 /TAXON_ID=400756 /ORGANISM="Durinskia baltica, Strain CSIRO CS-38" /LENGTH=121 /DNA_ID=CAMNT_0010487797 /DNA_START=104 /DNA_END=465 /DNA_ORIENTATION=-
MAIAGNRISAAVQAALLLLGVAIGLSTAFGTEGDPAASDAAAVGGEEAAYESDDQCINGDDACALSALQRRGVLKMANAEEKEGAKQEWSLFGTTEKCCRCKSGSVGWSASGKCSFCKGSV